MIYRAAVKFIDLQDGRHLYNAGEQFPREGLTVTPERIAELAGSDNRMGYPLIVAEAPVEPADAPDREIPAPAQKPAQKGRRSRQKE